MKDQKIIHDLLADTSFQNWVNQSDEKDMAKWEAWKTANPDQIEVLENATFLLNGFNFKPKTTPLTQVNKRWKELDKQIDVPKPKLINLVRRSWLKIAATILLLVVGGWLMLPYLSTTKHVLVENKQPKIKTIQLPDGSQVTLNTNSSIQYHQDWLEQSNRKVQLKGEAYFKVKPQPKGTTFQVQTKDISLTVIGTAFNCNSKRQQTIVSLTEGKVKLAHYNKAKFDLVAGQTAVFNPTQNRFNITANKTNYWKSWTMQTWSFGKGVPMHEVLTRIEETFQLKYEVKEASILQKQASGDVSVENLEVLLEALSALLDIEMTVNNEKLLIKSR